VICVYVNIFRIIDQQKKHVFTMSKKYPHIELVEMCGCFDYKELAGWGKTEP